MSLEHILLGQLRRPATGYQLGREFDDSAGHFWPAERSQIYPTLKRLEKKGWLTCTRAPSERGPARKVYRTTDAGRAELRRWLVDGPQIGRERLAYIGQVFYLGELDDFTAAREVILSMRDRWQQRLDLFEQTERDALAETGDWQELAPDEFFPLAALRNGLYTMRAKLAWCDEIIARLEARIEAVTTTAVGENRR